MTPQSIRPQFILVFAASLITTGILLGAFGAHGLKNMLSPSLINSFKTGVDYQIWEGLGLLILGSMNVGRSKKGKVAIRCISIGTIAFSFSIYALCFKDFAGMSWVKYLGWVTPVGGLVQIVGWFMVILHFYDESRHPKV